MRLLAALATMIFWLSAIEGKALAADYSLKCQMVYHNSNGVVANFHSEYLFDFATNMVTAIEYWADGPRQHTYKFVSFDNDLIVLYKDYEDHDSHGDFVVNGSIVRSNGKARIEFKKKDGTFFVVVNGTCSK